MFSLTVLPMMAKQATQKDFGAEVQGTQLLVPQDVAKILERLAVRTAEEFVSYLHAFPSAIAAGLGWKLEDVVHARAGLIAKLRGVVSDDILDPTPTVPRVYGARPPTSRT